MFQPSLVNLTGDPLHRVILNSINSFTDSLIRKELWNNIVLAGGYDSIGTGVGPFAVTEPTERISLILF
jgi:hypothetical protein